MLGLHGVNRAGFERFRAVRRSAMLNQTVITVGIFLRPPDYQNDPKRLLAKPELKKFASVCRTGSRSMIG